LTAESCLAVAPAVPSIQIPQKGSNQPRFYDADG